MTRRRARRWLASTWLLGSLALASILFFQTTVSEIYRGFEAEVWDWLTQALLPNACLMLGVLGAERLGRRPEANHVHKSVFYLACLISVTYLLAIAVVIFLVPIRFSISPIETSVMPLKFFQALVSVVIGIFFVAREGIELNGAFE